MEKSPTTKSQQTTEETTHHHYWPDGLVPVTPQARRFGYITDVYVSQRVWEATCVWPGNFKNTNTEKRIYDLLDSCFTGLSKATVTADDRLSFGFKHWSLDNNRPNAKKPGKSRLGARLLLHPETEEPWLLIFNEIYDTANDLKRGEVPNGELEENRGTEDSSGNGEPNNGSPVDSWDANGSPV